MGNIIQIDIADSGSGIPELLLPRIFNPYYTTKSAASGTGMGLYMSKMIVEKEMNGELQADNTEQGAKFTIKLKKIVLDRDDDRREVEELPDSLSG